MARKNRKCFTCALIVLTFLFVSRGVFSSNDSEAFESTSSPTPKTFEFSFPVQLPLNKTQKSLKSDFQNQIKNELPANLDPESSLPSNSDFTGIDEPEIPNVGDAGKTGNLVPESPKTKSESTKIHQYSDDFDYENLFALKDEPFGAAEDYDLSYEVYVRKCCSSDEAFLHSTSSCHHYETDFTIPGYITSQNLYKNITRNQLHIQEGLLTACAPSILEREEFIVLDSGELFSTELNEYFLPDNYCIETIVDDLKNPPLHRLTAAYCPNSNLPQTFDPNKVPVRKCCPQGEIVSSTTSECTARSIITTSEWSVPVENLGQIGSFSTNFTDIYEAVAGYPECVLKERGETMDYSWNFEILETNGYIKIPSLGTMTPSYCIDEYFTEDNHTSAFAYVCLSDSDHKKFAQIKPSCQPDSEFCVEKCCPVGHILNHNGHCIEDPTYDIIPQTVPVYLSNGNVAHIDYADYNFGSPVCGSRGLFLTKREERAEITLNGTLRFTSYDPNECDPKVVELIPKNDYCYDKVLFDFTEAKPGHSHRIVPGALICYPQFTASRARQEEQVNYIYSVFLVISDIFILISFVIYLTVPDQTKIGLNKNVKLGHSILGRILLSFLFSLFFAYLCLIIAKTASDPINLFSNVACVALGVVLYVSFLATFFWLNVLCFELWWKCARQESTSGRRWFWYQLYAWGNPVLLGSVVLYIEFSPFVDSCFVKPNFGIHSCFFSETRTFGSTAKWLYLNGPVALLLLTDLFFFLLTVKSLLQTVQQSHKGTVKRQARQRMKLCFKLFLVMGICWLTEIISSASSSHNWYITEVFNCLQGFVIFLIFILKPKIIDAIRERICACCCGRELKSQPLRGRLTFTVSVLSDFLASTKRPHPRLSPQNLSTTFSTASSNLSWTSTSSSSSHFSSPSASPAESQKASRQSPFLAIKEVKRTCHAGNSMIARKY